MKRHLSGTFFPCTGMLSAVILLFVFSAGCSGMKASARSDAGSGKYAGLSVHAGMSFGGFAENTEEMTGVKGATEADAITGATKLMFNLGVRKEKLIHGHAIESGIDYTGFSQEIEYTMPTFSVDGKRDVAYHQVRIPLTYNFHFSGGNSQPKFVLKAGVSAGYTFSRSIGAKGNPPGYDFTDWDVGPTFGMAYYFFDFAEKYRGGLFMDMYRGGRVFEDIYHKDSGLGGNSYYAIGIVVRPLGL